MATFFMRKNFLRVLASGICIVFVLLSIGYSLFLTQILCVPVYKNFYVLATETMHIEASAEFIKLEGGAGYVLYLDKREYVVMSIYLKKEEGEAVYASITDLKENVQLLHISIANLYFKGNTRKKVNFYLSALRKLESYLLVLNNCVSLLESGATQESIKRILLPTCKQISYLSQSQIEEYPAYAQLCKQIGEALFNIENRVVHTRDLRYISCELLDGYLRLFQQFKL